MSEHLEPLVAAYVAQRQRAFHRSTRGIPTPENRAVWEFDASEKIRAHDRKVKVEALREAAGDAHPFYPTGGHVTVTRGGLHQWLNDRADRIEKGSDDDRL